MAHSGVDRSDALVLTGVAILIGGEVIVSGTNNAMRMLGRTALVNLFVTLVLCLMCVCTVFSAQQKNRQKNTACQ
jgi:hypothetical protein